jgi:pyruvate/2-oxoglutarate dehydrogenase complex dihydrolipoamide dehydrogenase (E3) component
MTEILTPDICVIGAGSGGLTVAAAAAAFGVPVVLIEKGKMGGDCLNYGCVPSKALLAAGRRAAAVREAAQFGVMADPAFDVDFAAVQRHVRRVIETIEPNDSQERFTALGVKVIRAEAKFSGTAAVTAGEYAIRARRYVIATGSSPVMPPIPGLAETPHFTNETIFENTRLPQHLLIIGAGPIGLEMAQAHRRLGAKVTVVEAQRAFSRDDPEIAAIVLERLRAEGIDILEGAAVEAVSRNGRQGVALTLRTEWGEEKITGSHLLVAVGRKPNVEGLNFDKAAIAFDRRGIKVDSSLRTTNRRVYAIGDVAGSLQFTHVAGYHAGLALRSILFRLPVKADMRAVPRVTYTDPELAQVGQTEEEARAAHRSISVLRWPYAENDRAQAERATHGMIKVVADRRGRILGATIAGDHAGETIHVWALALSKRMKLSDISGYVAPYPTLGEVSKRAAVSFYAPFTRKPLVRNLVNFLRRFG